MAGVSAAVMACQIFWGVRGMSRWRMPRWARASITALWAAGMAPIVPASPMPFTPRGFWSVGVSVVWASKYGNSAALGKRYSAKLVVRGLPLSS